MLSVASALYTENVYSLLPPLWGFVRSHSRGFPVLVDVSARPPHNPTHHIGVTRRARFWY